MSDPTSSNGADDVMRLAASAPFDLLPSDYLRGLIARAALIHFPKAGVVASPDLGLGQRRLHVLKRGRIHCRARDSDLPGFASAARDLEPGDYFGAEAVLLGRPSRDVLVAAEDSDCWQLTEADSLTLLCQEPFVRHLFAAQLAVQDALLRAVRGCIGDRQVADQLLNMPLRGILERPPVTLAPTAPIGDAIAAMIRERIGSIVVADGVRPLGIVTQSDIVRRVAAAGMTLDAPVSKVMTAKPFTVSADATTAEAVSDMAVRSVRHLLVTDDENELVGIVSERDLFRVQRIGLGHFSEPIDRASSVDALRDLADLVRDTARTMFIQGTGAAHLTNMISALDDRISRRVLNLLRDESVARINFCWLSFGSQGRHEPTFVTDQDNGIIFAVPEGEEREATRSRMLAYADRVNLALDRCGFTLCQGNIMARNPDWCLTLDEWKDRFGAWIRSPNPEALLNASIFFDLRAIFGDERLEAALKDYLLVLSQDNPIFLRTLAGNALDVPPPLARFSRFKTDSGGQAGLIDLKTQGTRLFVDIGRLWALANGIRATGTEQRMRLGGAKLGRKATAIEADVAAFNYIQGMRLRQQCSIDHGAPAQANRVAPYRLNELEQRVLVESFRQARLLQEKLKLDYQL